MKVLVKEECIGCGLCETVCPQVFKIEDDGLSHVEGDPAQASVSVQDAAAACPVNAIEVEE